MGKNNSYIDFENIRNLLLNTEPLNKTVKNFINNSSFEGNNDIFYATGLTKEFSSEIAHSGSKSLKLTGSGYLYYAFPVSENDSHYTFSGYYKGTGKAKIYVEIHDENTLMYDFESEEFDLTDEFVRHEFSVFYQMNMLKVLICIYILPMPLHILMIYNLKRRSCKFI